MSTTQIRIIRRTRIADKLVFYVTVDTEDLPLLQDVTLCIDGRDDNTKVHRVSYYNNRTQQTGRLTHLLLPRKEGFVVDHKDRDPLNNSKSNLEYKTQLENVRNQGYRTNTTGFKGVGFEGTSYYIMLNSGTWNIKKRGYKTAEDAARAYDKLITNLKLSNPTNETLGLFKHD